MTICKTPIPRMYFRSPARIDPKITYVFPRPHGGGVILGGSRQENDWSAEIDMELSKDIMKRCCELCPELGKPEDLQVISHNVGLRRKCPFPLHVVAEPVVCDEGAVLMVVCSLEKRRPKD